MPRRIELDPVGSVLLPGVAHYRHANEDVAIIGNKPIQLSKRAGGSGEMLERVVQHCEIECGLQVFEALLVDVHAGKLDFGFDKQISACKISKAEISKRA